MTQQQEKVYTWKDLENAVGRDFSGGITTTGADPVGRNDIRRFCEPIEMDCPLYHDDEVARKHGLKGIIAPWSSINSTFTRPTVWRPGEPTRWPTPERNALFLADDQSASAPPLPKPKTTTGFATDIEIEYFAPVYVGDQLTVKGRKLVSVAVKRTSVGFGAFTVSESEIYNQRGELVARQRNGGYAYNPGASS